MRARPTARDKDEGATMHVGETRMRAKVPLCELEKRARSDGRTARVVAWKSGRPGSWIRFVRELSLGGD